MYAQPSQAQVAMRQIKGRESCRSKRYGSGRRDF